VSRANTRRKLFALKAIVLDAAKTCELAATMVTMDSCQLWQLNRDYLEDARARIAALPLFELSDSGLVSRICAIVFGLQGAISVADRISVRKSDDPKVTAEIFRTTYEICIETAVEITELLKTCSSADDFRRDSESLHRLAKNTKIAQEVIESLRTKPDETR
jgi:CRP-like cAMP-binding protein